MSFVGYKSMHKFQFKGSTNVQYILEVLHTLWSSFDLGKALFKQCNFKYMVHCYHGQHFFQQYTTMCDLCSFFFFQIAGVYNFLNKTQG